MLTIQLFGEFQVTVNGAVMVALHQPRLQSLLAYLLLHRHAPQSRQHLAFLFWPDTSEAQARANLRQVLHLLQQALPAAQPFLLRNSQTLQWRADAPYTLDVATFADHLAQAEAATARGDQEGVCVALAAAVALYQGDLLPACYDDWLISERAQWRERFLTALETLLVQYEAQGHYAAAIRYAQRLLQHDPLHESTYRHLMRLYALNGERAGALHAYHTCVSVLQRELAVDPHPATQAAYARLLHTPAAVAQVAPTPPATLGMALVGRQREWLTLQQAWRQASQAVAHFVLIAGEAGIGKSRLAEELWHWVTQQGGMAVRTRSYAAEGDLAYAPVIEWLRSPAFQTALQALEPIWLSEVARLLPELLVQQPALPRPDPLDERRARQRLFEALARAVTALRVPLLLLIDDLQWCDQETLAWLHYLLRFDPRARFLVVGVVRPEAIDAQHPLTPLLLDLRSSEQLTEIVLSTLAAPEVARLAAQVAGRPLTAPDLAHLYQASEGNPLFVVELVRAAMQAGGEPTSFAVGQLPTKVHAVIQARLQQLSPLTREVAGLAATIGRAFSFALVAGSSELGDEALLRGLDELWQRRLIREQGSDGYDFSHDLIREAAYTALTPLQRRLCHRRVAQALEALWAEDRDAVSAQLAMHYERAGLTTQAILCYERTATLAAGLFAYQQAIANLDLALALADTQPHTPMLRRQRLTLLLAKAANLAVIEGLAAQQIAGVYDAVTRLLPSVADDRLQFQAHDSLRQFYTAGGQLREAQHCAEKLLVLGAQWQNPGALVTAHHGCGIVYLLLGHLVAARHHLEQAEVAYHAAVSNATAPGATYPGSPMSFGPLALTLWLLGYPEQAQAKAAAGLTLSEQQGNPFHFAIAIFFASVVYRYMGAIEWAAAPAEQMLALDRQYQIPMARASGWLAQGWLWAHQGKAQAGMAQMRAGIDLMNAMNHTVYHPHRLAWLAEVQLQAQEWAAAAATLDEALALVEKTGQRSCEAELQRLRGEWLLQSAAAPTTKQPGDPSSVAMRAEAAFWQAIETARTQEAHSFELRAAMSLCRLWQRQGKQADARHLLAECYGWFTEGFATADLQAAQKLLDELSA
jgi:DNA-binding SARP family transcriptional activator